MKLVEGDQIGSAQCRNCELERQRMIDIGWRRHAPGEHELPEDRVYVCLTCWAQGAELVGGVVPREEADRLERTVNERTHRLEQAEGEVSTLRVEKAELEAELKVARNQVEMMGSERAMMLSNLETQAAKLSRYERGLGPSAEEDARAEFEEALPAATADSSTSTKARPSARKRAAA